MSSLSFSRRRAQVPRTDWAQHLAQVAGGPARGAQLRHGRQNQGHAGSARRTRAVSISPPSSSLAVNQLCRNKKAWLPSRALFFIAYDYTFSSFSFDLQSSSILLISSSS